MSEGRQCREFEFDVDDALRRSVIDLYKAAPLILEHRGNSFILVTSDVGWIEVVPDVGVYAGAGNEAHVLFALRGNEVKAIVFECEEKHPDLSREKASRKLYYYARYVFGKGGTLGEGLANRLEHNIMIFTSIRTDGVSETLKTLISRVVNFVDDYWESVKALENLIYGIAYEDVKHKLHILPHFAYLNLIGVDVFDILNDTMNKERARYDPAVAVSDVVDELIRMFRGKDDAVELLAAFAYVTGRGDLAHLIRKMGKTIDADRAAAKVMEVVAEKIYTSPRLLIRALSSGVLGRPLRDIRESIYNSFSKSFNKLVEELVSKRQKRGKNLTLLDVLTEKYGRNTAASLVSQMAARGDMLAREKAMDVAKMLPTAT